MYQTNINNIIQIFNGQIINIHTGEILINDATGYQVINDYIISKDEFLPGKEFLEDDTLVNNRNNSSTFENQSDTCFEKNGDVKKSLQNTESQEDKDVEPLKSEQLKEVKAARDKLFKERNIVAEIIPTSRVKICAKYPIEDCAPEIWRTTSKSVSYRNLIHCSSVWSCPVCSFKIRSERRSEVEKVISRWENEGKNIYFVTLTKSHKKELDAGKAREIIQSTNKEFSKILSNRYAHNYRKENDVEYIKALEVTYNKANGFHPHLHCLFASTANDFDNFLKNITEKWVQLNPDSKIERQDIQKVTDEKNIRNYLTKLQAGWELTDQARKKKTKDYAGINPLQIPEMIANENYTFAGKRYLELIFRLYHKAVKGAKFLTFSQGTKDRTGINDKNDSDIVQDTTNLKEKIATFYKEAWNYVLKNKLRAKILNAVQFVENYKHTYITLSKVIEESFENLYIDNQNNIKFKLMKNENYLKGELNVSDLALILNRSRQTASKRYREYQKELGINRKLVKNDLIKLGVL